MFYRQKAFDLYLLLVFSVCSLVALSCTCAVIIKRGDKLSELFQMIFRYFVTHASEWSKLITSIRFAMAKKDTYIVQLLNKAGYVK